MSYRTVKRLLGETSLERKCRFLFGGGLMILITSSFYFYARLNSGLIDDQNELRARYLVEPAVLLRHWKFSEGPNGEFVPLIDRLSQDLKPHDLPDTYTATLFKADAATAEGKSRP